MSNEKFTLIDVKKIINENKDCSDPLLYLSGIIEEKEREIEDLKMQVNEILRTSGNAQDNLISQIQSLTEERDKWKELAEAAERCVLYDTERGDVIEYSILYNKYQQLKNEQD